VKTRGGVSVRDLDFEKAGGLIPVIAQEYSTGEVLMLAYASPEAVGKILETGLAHYYSRSRGRLWMKGERSGNVQRVRRVLVDCDRDALLIQVDQEGNACHTGEHSCFHRELEEARHISKKFDEEMMDMVERLIAGDPIVRDPALIKWLADKLDEATPDDVEMVIGLDEDTWLSQLISLKKGRPLLHYLRRDLVEGLRGRRALIITYRFSEEARRKMEEILAAGIEVAAVASIAAERMSMEFVKKDLGVPVISVT